jgi:glycosyltransferase involved in cell wall biosynthesis
MINKNVIHKELLMEGESIYPFTFTVFTPTYCRGYCLERVYDSLKNQTFQDFEWLIVDDGSTDNTAELVKSWQKEGILPIHYEWQENRGKHIAFNRGVQLARGELFLTLDSDDACVPGALERFKFHRDAIPVNERAAFSGVTALCVDQSGKLIGDKFPLDVCDSDPIEMAYKYKVKGEKWGFHLTEVLKQFPFPELAAGKYVPESIVWDAIGKLYKTRFVNEPLRIYWIKESQSLYQFTHPDTFNSPFGFVLWHQSILNNHIRWFKHSPLHFFRSAVHYSRFSFHSGIKVSEQSSKLDNKFAKFLWLITMPLGFLTCIKDNIFASTKK